MAKTMSRTTRYEYLKTMSDRYRRYSGKAAKTGLLNEFCQVTGHERKYAIKLLKSIRGPYRKRTTPPPKPGRAKTYSEQAIDVVFAIWKQSEQPCGKRLVPMLAVWLPSYEKHRGELTEATKTEVLTISPAQIDRVLAPRKIGCPTGKRRPPKASSAMKALVPIRAERWDAKSPGWLEADTVAHCGGDMGESFVWSLTATDIFSGWTEVRPSWNRGQHSVCEAFIAIEKHLPFTILGVDTDNGGEFLNYHLHRHFTKREQPVEMTRSRSYRKNDQAHVEQKNSTHVRQLLGHDRLGYDQVLPLLFELQEAWCIWRNCFTTTFKQTEHRRECSRTIRRHEKIPLTPCERLIRYCRESGDESTATSLEVWRSQLDPWELKKWIEKKLTQIWKLDKALREAEAAGENDLDGVAAPILKGNLRSAPIAFQNRKHDSTNYAKSEKTKPMNQDATESPKVA